MVRHQREVHAVDVRSTLPHAVDHRQAFPLADGVRLLRLREETTQEQHRVLPLLVDELHQHTADRLVARIGVDLERAREVRVCKQRPLAERLLQAICRARLRLAPLERRTLQRQVADRSGDVCIRQHELPVVVRQAQEAPHLRHPSRRWRVAPS